MADNQLDDLIDDELTLFGSKEFSIKEKISKYEELVGHQTKMIESINGLISFYTDHILRKREQAVKQGKQRPESPIGDDISAFEKQDFYIMCEERFTLNKAKVEKLRSRKKIFEKARICYKEKIEDLRRLLDDGKGVPDQDSTKPKVTLVRGSSLFNTPQGSDNTGGASGDNSAEKESGTHPGVQGLNKGEDRNKEGPPSKPVHEQKKKMDIDFDSKNPLKDLMICVSALSNKMDELIMGVGYIKDQVDILASRMGNCESILDSIVAARGLEKKVVYVAPAKGEKEQGPSESHPTITHEEPKNEIFSGLDSDF